MILPRFVLVSLILSVFVLQNSCLLWVRQEGHLYLELSIRREMVFFSSYPKFLQQFELTVQGVERILNVCPVQCFYGKNEKQRLSPRRPKEIPKAILRFLYNS